jgi:inosose dehydratase
METRRRFLRKAGAAASLALAGGLSGLSGCEAGAAEREQRGEGGREEGKARKRPFELGIASYTFRKFSLVQALAMTRRVGISRICLKSFHLPLEAKPEEIAAAARKVKDAGIELYGGGVITMKDEAEVHQAFEYAKAAGMKTIVASPLPKILPLVSRKVEAYGIRVAIHNHGPGDEDYPTPRSVHDKIKDLDARVGICIDVGHTARIGADPVRSVDECAGRILDVHVKDVSAATPQGEEVEIGRGVIDIPGFLRALLRTGYSGVVAFEHEKDAGDPLPGLAESVGFVRGVLAAR